MAIEKEDEVETKEDCVELIKQWEKEQDRLAKCVVCENKELENQIQDGSLQRIGGLDISYEGDRAIGCLVVYDSHRKEIVYSDLQSSTTSVPYHAGFLAYREMPIYRALLNKLMDSDARLFPEVILVDGHGRLHPRHFGSACMVGVEYNCPTIGVGKNLFCGPSFANPALQSSCPDVTCDVCSDIHSCKEVIHKALQKGIRSVEVRHYGEVIALSYCPPGITKPIFISIGHRVSLDLALKIVSSLCVYRIPEPIRIADHLSREYIRRCLVVCC